MDESNRLMRELPDLEIMLAVKDPGQQEAPPPSQFLIRYYNQHSRPKGQALASLRLNRDLKSGTNFRCSFDTADKWVPLNMRGKVHQDRPNPLWSGLNVDLRDRKSKP